MRSSTLRCTFAFILLALPATAVFGFAQETDPLKRPPTEKQRKEQEKELKQELGKEYRSWLENDVRWIITDDELAAFKGLSNNEEREQFIEQFWLRRDPTPDTLENEMREEHYRRIAYANENYSAGLPGWKTDRGRIYVMYGPPDSIESNEGGTYDRPMSEGGGNTSVYPFQVWTYRNIDEIGSNIEIEFVDSCMCNNYRISIDRSEKDALLNTPNAGLTYYEQMGMARKADRFRGWERIGSSPFNRGNNDPRLQKVELIGRLSKPPAIKFKDLEEVVNTKIRYNMMPFDVRVDYVKVTADTALVPVTIQVQNRDLTFVNQNGVQRGIANVFGRVTGLTGRVAQTFEDVVQVDVPANLFEQSINRQSVYWKALPLRPGHYRLDVVVKDVNGDRMGTWSKGIRVPDFGEDNLAASSLILADKIERVASKEIGSGNFVIGDTKVRPRVEPSDGKPARFKTAQSLNFWMQVYNLTVDQKSMRPSATFEYEVVDLASKKPVIHMVESTDKMGNVGNQVTLEKMMPLNQFEPGQYQITVKVSDNLSKQTIAPTAKFIVER